MQKLHLSICLLVVLFLFKMTSVSAQGVGINESGLNPDASAILDVSSTDKGMLVPRMTTVQRGDISNPATGLMVYDTDFNQFWFFDGTSWTSVSGGGTNIYGADGTLSGDRELTQDDNDMSFLTGDGRFIINGNSERSGGAVFEKNFRIVHDPYTITFTSTDYIIIFDGPITGSLTLPATNSTEVGRTIILHNNTSATNNAATILLTNPPMGGPVSMSSMGGFMGLISDGTNWYTYMSR